MITLSAFFSLILQVVCVGSISACGRGWKTSLYSSLISLCKDFKWSRNAKHSIFVRSAAMTSELQRCSYLGSTRTAKEVSSVDRW